MTILHPLSLSQNVPSLSLNLVSLYDYQQMTKKTPQPEVTESPREDIQVKPKIESETSVSSSTLIEQEQTPILKSQTLPRANPYGAAGFQSIVSPRRSFNRSTVRRSFEPSKVPHPLSSPPKLSKPLEELPIQKKEEDPLAGVPRIDLLKEVDQMFEILALDH